MRFSYIFFGVLLFLKPLCASSQPDADIWYRAAYSFGINQQYDSAIKYAERSLKSYEQNGEWEKAIRNRIFISEMAFLYDDLLNYEDFIAISRRQARQFLTQEHVFYVQMCYYECLVLKTKRRLEEAYEFIQQSISLNNRSIKDKQSNIRLYSLWLDLLLEDKNIFEANKVLLVAKSILTEDIYNFYRFKLFNLSNQYYFSKQVINKDWVKELNEKNNKISVLIETIKTQTILYQKEQKHRHLLPILIALKDFQIKIWTIKNPQVFATQNLLGDTYRLLGRLDTALYYYNEALRGTVAEQGVENIKVAEACMGIGLLYRDLNDPQQSIYYFDQAASVFRMLNGAHSSMFAKNIVLIAESHLLLSSPHRAALAVQQALEILYPGFKSTEYYDTPDFTTLNSSQLDLVMLSQTLTLKSKIMQKLFDVSGSKRDLEAAKNAALHSTHCIDLIRKQVFDTETQLLLQQIQRQNSTSAIEQLWLIGNQLKR